MVFSELVINQGVSDPETREVPRPEPVIDANKMLAFKEYISPKKGGNGE
ncbi:hypothetical protein ACFLWR_06340 [Chloroflexota bacterium]